jgi:hypothetical protein
MARPLRLELPGGLYHVTSRGDRREDIYLNDADRLRWLDLLGEVRIRIGGSTTWSQVSHHGNALNPP